MTINQRYSKRSLSLAGIVVLLSAAATFAWQQPSAAPALSASERALWSSIKVDTIRDVVKALSADDMQGRGTAQAGGDKAAAYLAEWFTRLGLKPVGNKGTYLQAIKFDELEFLPATSLKVGETSFKLGPDFFVAPPYTGDRSVSGDLVFVAYGLQSNIPKRDDLAGVDVNGKVVILMQGPPTFVAKSAWKSSVQFNIIRNLVLRGAAAIVFLSNGHDEHPYAEMADYLTRRRIDTAGGPDLSFLPPFLSISDATADKLFLAAGTTRADALLKAESKNFAAIDLKQTAKINLQSKKKQGFGNNVLGLLEGSDPSLKSEAVVFSAHYDAYGVSSDNRIFHGAADNALGVGEMIAVAEALAKSEVKPRRSIIFLATTGEEYGGLGSTYWVKNPTWKIKQVAANLNLDGMGTEVYGPIKVLVGYGAEHSTLGNVLDDIAAASDLKVIPDPMPEEKSFTRSDHYFFVLKGIPGIMLLGAPAGETKAWVDRMKAWEKTDYHQPSDVVLPNWNWDGPQTIAQIFSVMGLRVANSDQMPAWVKSSPYNRERGTNDPAPEP
ncbi:MAG TPA: M20/M25/M40 family metallo-hydrolase [Pyrinomonadaceae bacterium]|nr:M20/M25/M40 family metallo-hydrolase [Pyrinomonadaceae bacterium]